MKTQIMAALCVTVSLGAVKAFAEERDDSNDSSVESSVPKAIACAQDIGDALGQCSYLIKRDGNGKTTVTVVFANGFKRGLIFKDGAFVKGSVTMSGVGTDTDWGLKDGAHIIRVDDQRFEVPDSVITGS